jgi:glycerate dehydrogenase
MIRIVFLDRDTLSPETVVRAPSVPHEMVVHAPTRPLSAPKHSPAPRS